MKSLNLEICVGTGCCLMGSQDLLDAVESLPAHKRRRIDLGEANCLKSCRKGPSVRLDGDVISGVTPKKLLELVDEKLA